LLLGIFFIYRDPSLDSKPKSKILIESCPLLFYNTDKERLREDAHAGQ